MLLHFGGIFDVDKKSSDLKELISKLSDPSAWDDPKTAQELNKQKVLVIPIIKRITQAIL